tara:strand:+ start:57 stop:683 length:627 start_codon:yes stop_codon:yes gene_type:complete
MNHGEMDHGKLDHGKMDSPLGANPCTDKLTDLEYLIHMIPHHQVAIDMSNLLIEKTRAPVLLDLCRQIIRSQSYEIWEMNYMKTYDGKLFTDDESSNTDDITNLDTFYPVLSQSKEGGCNPLFFKPNDHSKHMEGMEITGQSYLEHMIPHHQVAINMSKRLLLYTNNSYLLEFCKNLIINQQGEIFLMNSLLKNKRYLYESDILGDLS